MQTNIFDRFLMQPALRFLKLIRTAPANKEEGLDHAHGGGRGKHAALSDGTPEGKAVLDRISQIEWYHTIDLGHGVVTPGLFDHRPLMPHYHLPENLKDMRVLDVATFDGFWAFEFEKRGAAEVVAMDIKTWNDIDIPPRIRSGASREILATEMGTGFNIAKDILGSKVQRGIMNVYNLGPEWKGKFDFVFCGDLLLHLMNPIKALQNIHNVVSGCAYIIDVFNPEFGEDESNAILRYAGGTGRMVWWHFGLGSLKKMIRDAGFNKVELLGKSEFSVRGQKEKHWHAAFRAYP